MRISIFVCSVKLHYVYRREPDELPASLKGVVGAKLGKSVRQATKSTRDTTYSSSYRDPKLSGPGDLA